MSNVLSCRFPTTVVLVDDNASFLKNLKEVLENANIVCKAFTNPADALDYINDVGRANKLDYSDLIRDGEESTSDWKSVLLNIGGLHREIYSSDRFLKISAIVSDYMMPGMNGVDLCASILDKNIQRILLTGVAEDKKGIDAFNNGYITGFVKKDAENFEEDFVESINKSIYRYFRTYTNYISKHISTVEITHLSDPIFADFFSKIYSNGDYIESYMLDAFGSYLFLNADAQASMINVLTEAELSRLIEIGVASEEMEDDVLQKLQSRKYMIAYHSRSGALPPISEWGDYLRPAERVDGYQTYYFSMSDLDRADLDFDKIVSFNSFKKSL